MTKVLCFSHHSSGKEKSFKIPPFHIIILDIMMVNTFRLLVLWRCQRFSDSAPLERRPWSGPVIRGSMLLLRLGCKWQINSTAKASLPQVRKRRAKACDPAPAGIYGSCPKHYWLILKVTVTTLCTSVNRASSLWVYGLCNNFKQSEECVSTGDVGGTAVGRGGGQVENDWSLGAERLCTSHLPPARLHVCPWSPTSACL